jgi:hypothetical protein
VFFFKQAYCGNIIGRDLVSDVTASRSSCVKLELQSAIFRNSVSVFQADIQNDISDTGDTIVQKLRDAGVRNIQFSIILIAKFVCIQLASIEADRVQLLMQNTISVSISSTNSLTIDLRNSETTINKIIVSLDGDLSGLGQADRDLRTSILRVNTTYVDAKMNMKSNFDVTEFSVNEASLSVVSIFLLHFPV